MSLQKLDDISALLRAHLAGEADAGFPELSRVPSTGVIQFLDYFAACTAAERDLLLTALAEVDALNFFSPVAVRERVEALAATNPALIHYRQAMQSPQFTMGLRYVGLRMMKSMLADRMSMQMMARTRATLDFIPRDDLPAALVSDPDPAHLKPAKAPLLRKLVDEALRRLFASGKQKRIGGETEYFGALQGMNIKVVVDFSAMGLQLRYGVSIPDDTNTTLVWQRAYEDLWAAGPGWNCLTEENAEVSVNLLCQHIAQFVSLRNGVISLLHSSI